MSTHLALLAHVSNGRLQERQATDQRRGGERRRKQRRQEPIDNQRAEIDVVRDDVERNTARIQLLEKEQRVQLVRIAQLQREVDGLKEADRKLQG